jgi:hypothetical protein
LQQQSPHNETTRARKPRAPIPTTTTRKIHGASQLVQGELEVGVLVGDGDVAFAEK